MPSPSLFPDAAGYRFQKSSGEIIEKKQTQRDAKVRFEKFVGDAVVRTLHEVFEADRDSVIRLISLQAYVEHISSSTGKQTETVLAEVSTDRNRFLELDLRNVVALEAMLHLGAIVSKNMWGLTPIPTGKSIRRI